MSALRKGFVAAGFVIVLQLELVQCFNFEVREPVVKQGPRGSYFGYSVAMHKVVENGQNLLLVGAPQAQNLQPQTNHSGALFKCEVEGRKDNCEQVPTDGRKTDSFDYEDNDSGATDNAIMPPRSDEIKDGQWMGVSLKSQNRPGGRVIVCGHRYITAKNLSQSQHGFGLCYSLKNNLQFDMTIEPCKGRPTYGEHLNFGFCQAGTSVDLLDDNVALMGAPGPFTWRGTIFAYNIGDFMDRDNKMYIGPLSNTDEPISTYSYLGMSVKGGKFFNRQEVMYATGAPRSDYNGRVYIMRKDSSNSEMTIACIIKGKKFGSNFGYEILAVDYNNDGIDELLVSAPFEFDKDTGGAVYIISGLKKMCKRDSPVSVSSNVKYILGTVESRFGWSLAALGDINKDGYNDVAIGAPYEGNGAIYIYLGGRDGLTFSQKIQHESSGIKTIGYTLSGNVDIDDNGYPDLLMGAYDSDRVILYKARPIIDIETTWIDVDQEMDNIDVTKQGCQQDRNTNQTCFSFKTCLILKKVQELRFMVNLLADTDKPAAKFARVHFKQDAADTKWFNSSNSHNITCTTHTVYLRETVRDFLSPIKFLVDYKLDDNAVNSHILNRSSSLQFHASFLKDCGEDEKCHSELIVDATLKLRKSELGADHYSIILGQDNEINLNVKVANEGDPAYEAQLFISHDKHLSYVGVIDKMSNVKCLLHNDTMIICALGNPLPRDKSVALGIRFEGADRTFSGADKSINLNMWVNSTSIETSSRTRKDIVIDILKHYNLELKSLGTPYTVFGGSVRGESAVDYFDQVGSRVTHRYQVINYGPWYASDLVLKIMWPQQVAAELGHEGKWLLYLEDIPSIIFGNIRYFEPDNLLRNQTDSKDQMLRMQRNWAAERLKCENDEVPCELYESKPVNSLNLKHRNGSESLAVGQLTMPPPDMNFSRTSDQLRRRRRDLEPIARADTLVDVQNRKIVRMDCVNGEAKCTEIRCPIAQLNKVKSAIVDIRSRIWNSTFIEDYQNFDMVELYSNAEIRYDQNNKVKIAEANTVAYPEQQQKANNIWIYVLSAVVGVIVLLVLILILWKCGFFKRQRIRDHTLSGNLQKKEEQDSLLQGGKTK